MFPNDSVSELLPGTANVFATPPALLSTLHWPSQVHPFAQHLEHARCHVLRQAAFGLVVSFAPFRWGTPLRRMFERIAKSVSTNHSSRAHDYQALLTRAGDI